MRAAHVRTIMCIRTRACAEQQNAKDAKRSMKENKMCESNDVTECSNFIIVRGNYLSKRCHCLAALITNLASVR